MNALAAAIVIIYSAVWYLLFSIVGDNCRRVSLLRLTLLIEEKILKTGARFQRWWSAAFAALSYRISNHSLNPLAELHPESVTTPLALNSISGEGTLASAHVPPEEYSGI